MIKSILVAACISLACSSAPSESPTTQEPSPEAQADSFGVKCVAAGGKCASAFTACDRAPKASQDCERPGQSSPFQCCLPGDGGRD